MKMTCTSLLTRRKLEKDEEEEEEEEDERIRELRTHRRRLVSAPEPAAAAVVSADEPLQGCSAVAASSMRFAPARPYDRHCATE